MIATVPAGALAGAIPPKTKANGIFFVYKNTAVNTKIKAPNDSAKIIHVIPLPNFFNEDNLSSSPIVKATNAKAISVINDNEV